MKYKIMIEKPAQKFIKRLDKVDKERILRAIAKLPDGDTKALQGHKGYYCLRVGSYRIIYTIHNGEYIICIVDAGNRGEIYKKY